VVIELEKQPAGGEDRLGAGYPPAISEYSDRTASGGRFLVSDYSGDGISQAYLSGQQTS